MYHRRISLNCATLSIVVEHSPASGHLTSVFVDSRVTDACGTEWGSRTLLLLFSINTSSGAHGFPAPGGTAFQSYRAVLRHSHRHRVCANPLPLPFARRGVSRVPHRRRELAGVPLLPGAATRQRRCCLPSDLYSRSKAAGAAA